MENRIGTVVCLFFPIIHAFKSGTGQILLQHDQFNAIHKQYLATTEWWKNFSTLGIQAFL